eukprot:COSAG02_NODE_966_length_15587_cov_19.602376_17_plen_118_part_00
MRTKPCPVASHLQLVHDTLHYFLHAPLVAHHHVRLGNADTHIRLPICQGRQRRLGVFTSLLLPSFCGHLLQGFGHSRVLQQGFAATRVHGKLCDGLGNVLLAAQQCVRKDPHGERQP